MEVGAETGIKAIQLHRETLKGPERLSDEEMGNLLSAIGNHEGKSITLLAMELGKTYPRNALYRRVLEVQGSGKGWRMGHELPYDYCKKSLSSPLSLVTREVVEDGGLRTYGYMKTDYGISIGEPLAGLLLDFSRRYTGISLQDIFAQTSSSAESQEITEDMAYRKRAPIVRLKIFWELLTAELPIRLQDLAERTREVPNLLADHIRGLKKSTIIRYEAREQGKPFSFYSLSANAPDSQPSPHKHLSSLTLFIYKTLKEDPLREWTAGAMADYYLDYRKLQGLPSEDGWSLPSVENLRIKISGIFSQLAKEGYTKRRKFSKVLQSDIDLSLEQRVMLYDLLTLLDGFQNQDRDIISLGRTYAQEIINDPIKVSALMRKAQEHSPNARHRPISETAHSILYIINEHPDSDAHEIETLLGDEEIRIGTSSLQKILAKLIGDGKLSVTSERGVRRFRIAKKVIKTPQE